MSKIILFLLAFSLSLTSYAKEISGVEIQNERIFEGKSLQLKGAGVRDKFFMDLYVASLYTSKKYNNFSELVNANEPMLISLHIVSSMITSEKMENSTLEGFEKSTNGNTKNISEEIKNFIMVFKEPIKTDDVYDLLYLPNDGVKIYKNSSFRVSIPKLEFKKALFGIWLGYRPAQESLKKELLGD